MREKEIIILRLMRIKGIAFGLLVVAPFFVFAQNPSLDELELQLEQKTAAYEARIERIRQSEAARKPAIVITRVQATQGEYLRRAISPNFEVTAPTYEIAEKVCLRAEEEWAKSGFPNLYMPCKIRVKVGQIGAGGATTFSFGGGQVFGFDMTVQGSLEKILKSVIPHEVRHMITACHKRRPVARWLDEGIAGLCEEDSERNRQMLFAKEIAGTNQFIPLRELLSAMDYPKDMQKTLSLYAAGTALSDFLVTRAAAASGQQWTLEESWQWMMDFEEAATKKGWDATLYDLSKQKNKPLGGITNSSELSNEFTKWLKGGKAQIYAFREAPDATEQNVILPVKYFNDGVNRVVPAN